MYVTNTRWELADILKFCEKRGNCENYIKETYEHWLFENEILLSK
jgi:hypothetical protein